MLRVLAPAFGARDFEIDPADREIEVVLRAMPTGAPFAAVADVEGAICT